MQTDMGHVGLFCGACQKNRPKETATPPNPAGGTGFVAAAATRRRILVNIDQLRRGAPAESGSDGKKPSKDDVASGTG